MWHSAFLVTQSIPLFNPEFVLFVNHNQPQILEHLLAVEQSMRANNNVSLPRFDTLFNSPFLRSFKSARQQLNPNLPLVTADALNC
jgi:hypothetical protein